MSSIAEKLHKWSVQELNIASEGDLSRIPDVESLRILTKGKNKRMWTYVINHVRSHSTVEKIKRTLFLKKLLKEKEDNPLFYDDTSVDVVRLRTAVSKTRERRMYLMRSLSIVQERILNLEQEVQKTKDETFQINQKTALLEYLKQLYDEKNSTLKEFLRQISSYKSALDAYQIAKVCDSAVMALPQDFLFKNKTIYNENSSRVNDIIHISASIFKKNFDQDNESVHILKENLKNNTWELHQRGVLLTDLVILLEEMSSSDLHTLSAVNLQSLSVKQFMQNKNKENLAKKILVKLKCDNVRNSLNAKKSKKEIEKLSLIKKMLFKDRVAETKASGLDCAIKCSLLKINAENNALVISNNCLESFLEDIGNKTDMVLKNIRQKKLCNEDHSSIIQMFYSHADLTFYLLYTVPVAIQKTLSNLDELQRFVHDDISGLPFPHKEWVSELKACFASEKKLMWDYCSKTKLVKPLFSEPLPDYLLSPDIQKSLNFQPFQSICILCEKWTCFKQKLRDEVITNAEISARNNDISMLETHARIIKMLEEMKFSIEKGMLFVSDGMTCCLKTKHFIQEWWDQKAQYIPHIEYENKTLKMWIDILLVLSDFEPQNYA